MIRARVLIVDDSATMRALIRAVLQADPGIEIVGEAGDPLEARQAIKALDPDVITLDVEMPNMNGLEFLERIMRLRPMPVIMVSTLTHDGAEAAITALELGAFDCVGKPRDGAADGFLELAGKVRAAAVARVRATAERPAATPRPGFKSDGRIVAMGSSTGGVEALMTILSQFPANCPPTVITQHMPASFTRSLAQRLDRTCAPEVQEAFEGAPLLPGTIYLAPGGEQHLEIAGVGSQRCRLSAGDPVNGHRPSVDVLFRSVAAVAGKRAVGVILTGMGDDGARGLLAMRERGARTLGQDEASCVVYGMPRVAQVMGAVERQARIDRLAQLILDLCDSSEGEVS